MWAISASRTRPDLLGHGGEAREIQDAGVGARPGHDEFRSGCEGRGAHLVVVDGARLPLDAVEGGLEVAAGEVHGVTVGEVPAVGEVQAEDRVSRFQKGEIGLHVGLGPRVRLHVGVVGVEEQFGALDGQPLGDIHMFAAAVVAAAGIALGVLVHEHGVLGLEDGLAREVLRGDELELLALTPGFEKYGPGDLRVGDAQVLHGPSSLLPVVLPNAFPHAERGGF